MVRWLVLFLILPVWAQAATPQDLERLRAAFGSSELMAILSEEGLEQAEDLRQDMFPGRGGSGWTRVAEGIYAPQRLETIFAESFDAALAETDVSQLLEFYASDVGFEVVTLEVSARRAIMSPDVEEAARAAWDRMSNDGSRRSKQIRAFAELNDLIERNVTGALNASLVFYKGLTAEGTFEMSEGEILDQVWGSAADIREETEGWVFGYMAFAYEPMSDAAFQEYLDLSSTDAGRALNRAMFEGFEAVFEDVSFALGRATARFALGDEL